MSKLKVKKVVIFKHGVSYFILEGNIKGPGTFELEFNIDEMDDILKSLFVLDTSESGYISSISYDAAMDISRLLSSIALNVPDDDSFSLLLKQIKGANINLTMGSEIISGKVMGIEHVEKFIRDEKITEKLIILLKENNITKIPFSEINSFEILNEDLKKDLEFFLDTVIAGKKKDTKKIIINCESGTSDQERSIVVSYFQEAPIWKTTYRLIMSKKGILENKCLLSGWCMVENITNQDWEDIELSLVAGMPISFKYEFYRPIFIKRPIIQPGKVLSAKPMTIEESGELKSESLALHDRAPAFAPKPKAGRGAAVIHRAFGGMDNAKILEKVKAQTSVKAKDLGELFEYNISTPVSIKRKHSALVPILNEEIQAKKILLYNKDHDKNPSTCLEITNSSNLTLERGPVTIIYEENLAGEAILPFLNKGETRIINYAIELAVHIDDEEESERLHIHRVSIEGQYLKEYYFVNLTTTYKIKNKADEEKDLYIDHPKKPGYKIKESPVGPEETTNFWRFKLELEPKTTTLFQVKERNEVHTRYQLWNWSKEQMIKRISFYIAKRFINEKLESQLKEIGELIGKMNDLKNKKNELNTEVNQMRTEQQRVRENIKVLGNTSHENSLREKYVKKLTEQENKFESISAEIKSIEPEIEKLRKEISKKMDELSFN